MKIIVTGCKGQLGTEIIKQLREGCSEIGPIPEKLLNATVIPVDLPELDILQEQYQFFPFLFFWFPSS